MIDPALNPQSNASASSGSRFDGVALVFAMVFPTLVTLVYFQWLNDSESSLQQTAFGIGKVLQFGFPVVWVWMWHRSKFRCCQPKSNSPKLQPSDQEPTEIPAIEVPRPEIPPERPIYQIGIGIGFGILVVASMFAVYFGGLASTGIGAELTELVCEKVSGMNINSWGKFVGMGIFYAICHSFLEEYYWRWFVFDFLQKFVSTLAANLLSSLAFMAHHVILLGFFFGWDSPLTYGFSLCIAVGGSVWAWQYKKTGSLLAPWISHMIVDAGIFSLGYFIVRTIL